jgi:ABC-2 type transport system permease protein
MKAELAKVRYLPLPRWTAALVAAAVIVTGIVMLIVAPSNPSKYIDIPQAADGTIIEFAAIIFGVWLSTLEFSAGTMQRTLTAEPKRSRVLTDKLLVVCLATLVGGILVAAAAGGFAHLAASRAHVDIDNSELAGTLFGAIPAWIAGSVVGFGAGLITRSFGGGIAIALVFVLAFDGAVSFIPPLKHLTYGQLTADMTNNIGGFGDRRNGLGVAILGTVIWCLILVVPGWMRFLRGDLK